MQFVVKLPQVNATQLNIINSLRPSDAIWRQWSWTTLAQVMACCLTAPSHYLNQCWLITRGVLWHTSESSFAGIAQGIDSGYEFEKDILKNIFKSPRGQWVKWPGHECDHAMNIRVSARLVWFQVPFSWNFVIIDLKSNIKWDLTSQMFQVPCTLFQVLFY